MGFAITVHDRHRYACLIGDGPSGTDEIADFARAGSRRRRRPSVGRPVTSSPSTTAIVISADVIAIEASAIGPALLAFLDGSPEARTWEGDGKRVAGDAE